MVLFPESFMVDDGETDWKLFVLNVQDPLANLIHTPQDLQRYLPGAVEAAREYFRVYKVCTDKEPNNFGLGEKVMSAEYALAVIEETHGFWKKLQSKNTSIV